MPQQGAGGGGIERMQGVTQAGAAGVLEGDQVRNVGAAGQDAQARIVHGQSAQQGLHRRVLELAAEATGRLLERLQAVEHQERPLGGDQFGEFSALGPRVLRHLAGVPEPREGGVEEIVGTGTALGTGPLAVEAPVEDAPRPRPAVPSAARIPFQHDGRLPLAALPDERDDVDLVLGRAAPRFVQQMQLLLAADKLLARDAQPGRGNSRRRLGLGRSGGAHGCGVTFRSLATASMTCRVPWSKSGYGRRLIPLRPATPGATEAVRSPWAGWHHRAAAE